MTGRGASSLNARISSTSAVKRKLGLTMAELEVVVAVAACWRAHGGYPTWDAIRATTRGGRTKLVSDLTAAGILRQVGRFGHYALYGITEAAAELLGIEPPVPVVVTKVRDAATIAAVLREATSVNAAAFRLKSSRTWLRAHCMADDALRPLFCALVDRAGERRRAGMRRLKFAEAG